MILDICFSSGKSNKKSDMDDSQDGESEMRSISILTNQILEVGSSQSKLVLARHGHVIKNKDWEKYTERNNYTLCLPAK